MLSGGGLQANANWDAFCSSMRSLGYVEGVDVVYERRERREASRSAYPDWLASSSPPIPG